jgi:hypothetical protein
LNPFEQKMLEQKQQKEKEKELERQKTNVSNIQTNPFLQK